MQFPLDKFVLLSYFENIQKVTMVIASPYILYSRYNGAMKRANEYMHRKLHLFPASLVSQT